MKSMKRAPRPLFRFVGKPNGGVRTQFAVAQFVQEIFFRLNDRAEVSDEEMAIAREQLVAAGVEISQPSWFANLLFK